MAVAAPGRRRRSTGAQPVDLGRFSGGLNNLLPREAIGDTEVTELINLEVDLDGSLVTRPPIERSSSRTNTQHHKVLGYATRTDNRTFLVVTFPGDQTTWVFDLVSSVWTQITNYEATSFVQYDNKVVLSTYLSNGGYWDISTGVYTATPQMPQAQQIVFFLGRFWAIGPLNTAGQTTLYWSKLTVPGVSSVYDWAPSSDYITVGAGDGQPIVGMIADPSGLIVLKTTSTYRFTYASGPATGTLQTLSNTVGADSQYAYASVDNYYIVFCAGTVYQMLQGKYYPLNKRKITFQATNLENLQFVYGTAVSTFGDRVMVWYYGTLYCYNLITQTWCIWYSYDSNPAMFFTTPPSYSGSGPKIAYVTTGVVESNRRRLYRITEKRAGVTAELGGGYQWSVGTKTYDFGAPFSYKRLMMWAVTLTTALPVRATAYAPSPVNGSVDYDMNLEQTTRTRAKVRSAFRFLTAAFRLGGNTDGTTVTRIYGLTMYLRSQDNMAQKEA